MELVVLCVSWGFETGGSGFGKGSGLGSGGGYGEWFVVIGVVGILSVDSGSSTSHGELAGSSENRLLITWLIAKISSSTSLPGSSTSMGFETFDGVYDEVWLATI